MLSIGSCGTVHKERGEKKMIYEEPKVDVIEFTEVDITTLSNGGTGSGGSGSLSTGGNAKASGGWLFGDD